MEIKDVKNAADKKFITQFFGTDLFGPEIVLKSNIFSGEQIEVDKGIGMLVDWIHTVQQIYTNANALKRVHKDLTPRNAISKFDRARYLVMKLDSAAYSVLLD